MTGQICLLVFMTKKQCWQFHGTLSKRHSRLTTTSREQILSGKLARNGIHLTMLALDDEEFLCGLQDVNSKYQELEEQTIEWKVNRQHCIEALEEIVDAIAEEERRHRIGQITYSSVGVVGGGLTIAGIIAAPFTLGASLALSVAGVATGVTSGVAGITHASVKESIIHSKCKKAREILDHDRELSNSLQEKLEEVRGITESLTKKLGDDEKQALTLLMNSGKMLSTVGYSTYKLVQGSRALHFLRTAENVEKVGSLVGVSSVLQKFVHPSLLKTTEGVTRISGKVLGPLAGVFIALDAISIGYNVRKLHTEELNEQAKILKESIDRLREGLRNNWLNTGTE